ncbi:MAG: DUF2917 domain-containing protein [Pseudomonadota bacterium]|nr:DUF2917 domain-containing protein [Pseudomonadota bacterium]
MKTQSRNGSKRGIESLAAGQARHLDRRGGELTVLTGRLWLTRNGAQGDHFLEAGAAVQINADEFAVVESAFQGQGSTLRWAPRTQTLAGRILAGPLLGSALAAHAVANGIGALAQRLSGAAQRARGCTDRADPA